MKTLTDQTTVTKAFCCGNCLQAAHGAPGLQFPGVDIHSGFGLPGDTAAEAERWQASSRPDWAI